MTTPLARTLAEGVRLRGADIVFGLPGGGPNLEVVGAAVDQGLRFVLAHDETAVCIMAATYGLLVGRPAMAIATRGPGAANGVNGVAQATLDRFPLLFVTDCVASADAQRVAHQRIDQQAMLSPVTKWSGRLTDTAEAAHLVRTALDLAASRPAGAVHLDYDPSGQPVAEPHTMAGAYTNDDQVERARELLRNSTRPVAIVGIGALADAAATRLVLERLGCPVLTTYQTAGLLPEGHRQLAGLFTNGAIESPLLDQADLLLLVGLDQVEPMPPRWTREIPVASVDDVPTCSLLIPITVEVVGPIAATLDRVIANATTVWPIDAGERAFVATRRTLMATTAGGFGPLELAAAVATATPSNAMATVDAGAHFLAIMPFWPAAAPLRLLISNGLATMGFSLPAAIGAALARPGTPVVCMVGDGGLAMTLAELETVARLRLPITIVVFDDAALSLIEIKQKPAQGGPDAVRFTPVDYAAVARAMGLGGLVVDSVADVEKVLASGWEHPRLIDARIDPATYPALITATRG
jgi:acetolactate synthase I/II/III large subunit